MAKEGIARKIGESRRESANSTPATREVRPVRPPSATPVSYTHLKWSMYLITSYDRAENDIGRKADKNRKIYNGMLKTYYYQFLGPKPPRRKKD